ncbi:hypothetical protein ACFY8C_38395 [Streptomyces flavochromogenes]|uniref:Uncharacterized protein n=1 Tax=Streptomyces flavochromogenes TaxID=68199 RepID=A0ABW6Y3G3_9ACTN
MTITYIHLGPSQAAQFESEFSEKAGYTVIGANVLAGFVPVVHVSTPEGEPLRTPGGELLTVVALTGSGGRAVSALAYVGGQH